MILEEILEDIEENGGIVTDVNVTDAFATLTYVDSGGTTHTNKYSITINTDGSEDWEVVS